MRIQKSMIPDNIWQENGKHDDYIDIKRFVYFKTTKAIYGLA